MTHTSSLALDLQVAITSKIEDFEINVLGSRFGDETVGWMKFSKSAFDGAFKITLPDSDDPEAYTLHVSPPTPNAYEVGNEDSEVFFDSKTCIEGIGSQTVVDALYKCTDVDGLANYEKVCP